LKLILLDNTAILTNAALLCAGSFDIKAWNFLSNFHNGQTPDEKYHWQPSLFVVWL